MPTNLQCCRLTEVWSVFRFIINQFRPSEPFESCAHPLDLVAHGNKIELLRSLSFVPCEIAWTESIDVDQDTIEYIVYANVGQYSKEEIYDTTGLSYPLPYQDIAEEAFRNVPGNKATIRFSVWAHD